MLFFWHPEIPQTHFEDMGSKLVPPGSYFDPTNFRRSEILANSQLDAMMLVWTPDHMTAYSIIEVG
jgi:hypothetical protein